MFSSFTIDFDGSPFPGFTSFLLLLFFFHFCFYVSFVPVPRDVSRQEKRRVSSPSGKRENSGTLEARSRVT